MTQNLVGIIRQTGENLFITTPIFLVDVFSEKNQEVHLYIARPDGVTEDQVRSDVDFVRTSTRTQPPTPEAVINQVYDLLQRRKGYVPLSGPKELGTLFLRAPSEQLDHYRRRGITGYQETLSVLQIITAVSI